MDRSSLWLDSGLNHFVYLSYVHVYICAVKAEEEARVKAAAEGAAGGGGKDVRMCVACVIMFL